jgi:hypothetical protein
MPSGNSLTMNGSRPPRKRPPANRPGHPASAVRRVMSAYMLYRTGRRSEGTMAVVWRRLSHFFRKKTRKKPSAHHCGRAKNRLEETSDCCAREPVINANYLSAERMSAVASPGAVRARGRGATPAAYGAGAPAFRSRSLSEAIHSSASASVAKPSIVW